MTKDSSDIILFYIGDTAFSLDDLGPAADMRIDQGLQHIIDAGLLGEKYKGQPWYEVMSASGLKLHSEPEEDDALLAVLFQRWKDVELEIKAKSLDGKLTSADRELIGRAKRDYESAKKLSTL